MAECQEILKVKQHKKVEHGTKAVPKKKSPILSFEEINALKK
jgi:hypothetical protein